MVQLGNYISVYINRRYNSSSSSSSGPKRIHRLSEHERAAALNDTLFFLEKYPEADRREITIEALQILSKNSTNNNNNRNNNNNNRNNHYGKKNSYKFKYHSILDKLGTTYLVGGIIVGSLAFEILVNRATPKKQPTPESIFSPPIKFPNKKEEGYYPTLDSIFNDWVFNAKRRGLVVPPCDKKYQICQEIITNLEQAIVKVGTKNEKKERKERRAIQPVHIKELIIIESDVPSLHVTIEGQMYASTGIFNVVKNEEELGGLICYQLALFSARSKKEKKGKEIKPYLFDVLQGIRDSRCAAVLVEAGYHVRSMASAWKRLLDLNNNSIYAINVCHPVDKDRISNIERWKFLDSYVTPAKESFHLGKALLSLFIYLPPYEKNAEFWEHIRSQQEGVAAPKDKSIVF